MTCKQMCIFLVVMTAGGVLHAAPATQPLTPEQAVYRSNVALVETLMTEPSDDELLHLGRHYRSRGDFPRATTLHLAALRGKADVPGFEYELACDFALWGHAKLGMSYLQRAADHGYWGYPVIADDTDVDALKKDPAFPAAMAKIKANFSVESLKHAPDITLKTPTGKAPVAGWPVVVFLHGWGSSRHDFDDDAAFVATLGYVGITLDANDVMGPGAYTWGNDTVDPTNKRIQAALKGLKVAVDSKRIYLQGFSQGAMHAARLLADHPDLYGGAICNSPGPLSLVPPKLSDPGHTGTIVLSLGSHEHPDTAKGVNTIFALWNTATRPAHLIRFEGGHQLPPDRDSMYRTALEQISGGK